MACLPKDPGAFKSSIYALTKDQMRQLKLRKVKMADVEQVLRSTVAVTSVAALQEYEKFNACKGTRTF